MNKKPKSNNSGGAATQIGINYQNRVAAWICARILAEKGAPPLWKLPSDTSFEFLHCETGQPVDDILVGTSQGGHCFINVKHTVYVSQQSNSPLVSAINQIVGQYLSYKGKNKGARPWEKELELSTDRLILVVSSKKSPAALIGTLPNVLAKIRDLSLGEDLDIFSQKLSSAEKEVLTKIREQIAKNWVEISGHLLTKQDELPLLKLIWVEVLNVDENENGEREAKNLLRAILQDPAQSEIAWDSLIQFCANLASRQSGAARSLLYQHLTTNGIRLKDGQNEGFNDKSVQPPIRWLSNPGSPRRSTLHNFYQSIEFVGREQEFIELIEFLNFEFENESNFVWWLWTAPGGQGKTRLAAELCQKMQSQGWNCGVLSATAEFKQWNEWVINRPTLVVIDHIAYRAKDVRDALCSLARQSDNIRAPLRFLLLERSFEPNDTWIQEFVPQAFSADLEELFEFAYPPSRPKPLFDLSSYERKLEPLDDDQIWRIFQAVFEKLKTQYNNREESLKFLKRVDSLQRPLFAIFAAEAISNQEQQEISHWNSSNLVQFILRRDFDLWLETLQIKGNNTVSLRKQEFEEHLNLVVFSTIAKPRTGHFIKELQEDFLFRVPDRIYPDWLRIILGYSSYIAADEIPPLEPDILGELFILERLAGNFGLDSNRQIPKTDTKRLLDISLAAYIHTTIDFIKRCAADFPEHSSLEHFTKIQIPEGEQANFGYYVDYAVHMSQVAEVFNEAKNWNLACQCYTSLIESGISIKEKDTNFRQEIDTYLAKSLHNRALGQIRLNKMGAAGQDCDQAIEMIENLSQRSDLFSAFSLENLKENLYLRRAFIRINQANFSGAVHDLEEILANPNSPLEIRTEALLLCAHLYIEQDNYQIACQFYQEILRFESLISQSLREQVIREFPPILWSEANRISAEDSATALKMFERIIELSPADDELQAMCYINISNLYLRHGDFQSVINYCNNVLQNPDSPPQQRSKALANRSQAYLAFYKFDLALSDTKIIIDSANESEREYAMARIARAQIFYFQGDSAKAIEELLTLSNRSNLDEDLQQIVGQLISKFVV